MAGTVGRGAGALCNALAVVGGHAAEGALVDASFRSPRERHAIVFQLDHRSWRLLAHELDGVLVAQPVRALHGVVHVPAPVVLAHVGERSTDPALRGHRVAARRKDLGDAGGRQPCLGQPQRGAQARASRADDQYVVAVIDERIGRHVPDPQGAPSVRRTIASNAMAASSTCTKPESTSPAPRAAPRTYSSMTTCTPS